MRVCLMIEGQEDVTWEQWLALAGACEEHGLEALFRSDHYESVMGMRERGSLDAWTTLAALAARTSRIRLGTLVSPATFRHPSVLAKSVATVDHVSGGRVELGLGAGWHEGEHRAYGFEFPPTPVRMERLAEQLELVTRSWTEDAVTFEGRHYQVQDLRALPKPVQRPRPTLLVGGAAGPKSLALAARWADEYNTVGATADQCRERRDRIAAACAEQGRDPIPFSLMTGFAVAGDHAARLGRDPSPGWLTGTPGEIVEQLKALEAAGVERVMLQHLLHDDLDVLELIGREVIPEVR
jgi:F420-dependent oxidoreductase-like protein